MPIKRKDGWDPISVVISVLALKSALLEKSIVSLELCNVL